MYSSCIMYNLQYVQFAICTHTILSLSILACSMALIKVCVGCLQYSVAEKVQNILNNL